MCVDGCPELLPFPCLVPDRTRGPLAGVSLPPVTGWLLLVGSATYSENDPGWCPSPSTPLQAHDRTRVGRDGRALRELARMKTEDEAAESRSRVRTALLPSSGLL